MEHNFDHCTGTYYDAEDALNMKHYACPRRNICKRHIANEELINDMDSLPKGTQINFLSAADCVRLSYGYYINYERE